MDGAAPITITKKIAVSLGWKSRIASGNQAIDGIVCRPVISEPMAARSTRNRDTARPMAVPITTANAKPVTARRRVIAMAFHSTAWCASFHSSANAARGPGSTYVGFQPDQTTTCQTRDHQPEREQLRPCR